LEADMLIEVEVRNVYGKTLFYPINDKAHMLALIAGTETLTNQTLKLATDMGMTVSAKVVFPPEAQQYANG
jgi:hypothetical protein